MSKKEFADKCGLTTRELAVYVGRNKVFVGENDQIDDTNPINSDFYLKHKDKKKTTVPDKKESKTKPPTVDKKAAAKKAAELNTIYNLEKETKSIDIESKRKRNELLTMELAKKSGKLIPTSDVKALFAQHCKSITVSFGQFIENFIAEIAQKYKLNINEKAEIRGKMITMLNSSVDEAVNTTRVSMENLRAEMANRKES